MAKSKTKKRKNSDYNKSSAILATASVIFLVTKFSPLLSDS